MSREWPKVSCPHCGGSLEEAGGFNGDDLRRIREGAGLGLRQFARLADISPGYAALMETGKRPVSLWAPALYRQTVEAHAAALEATAARIRGQAEARR